MEKLRFAQEELSSDDLAQFKEMAKQCRGDIIKMTTLANSGHPGGSMSSIEIYLMLYAFANIDPKDARNPMRDKVVVSHGHTSPGAYSALGRLGFVDTDEAIACFRLAGSAYEGHVERNIPGIEWGTGNLGQGLSAACGFALAAKAQGIDNHIYCFMGDGEQQKGQIDEARRFIHKYKLNNITVIVDYNRLQLSGSLSEIMPVEIAHEYVANGFKVVEINGHEIADVYSAIRQASHDNSSPYMILAHTEMGMGVSFMEGQYTYHGMALDADQYKKAILELGVADDLQKYKEMRAAFVAEPEVVTANEPIKIDPGSPRTYEAGTTNDNRSAFGNALKELGEINCYGSGTSKILVFDCDLLGSTKTGDFAKACPEYFYQGGIQEHNTASIAGAASAAGVVSFFADFGVFGVDETYNQHRLSDINNANVKVACTHCGIDVGEDGKTHQCIDYVGTIGNLFNFTLIVPADPNQTDRAVRYAAATNGNFMIIMGRSKLPIIAGDNGSALFGGDYEFEVGSVDRMRNGKQAVLVTMGTLAPRAIKVWEILRSKGIDIKVLNCATPVNINRKRLISEAADTGNIIFTYEDHNTRTGLGSMIANVIAEERLDKKLVKYGAVHYSSSGASSDLFKLYGLDEDSIAEKIEKVLASE